MPAAAVRSHRVDDVMGTSYAPPANSKDGVGRRCLPGSSSADVWGSVRAPCAVAAEDDAVPPVARLRELRSMLHCHVPLLTCLALSDATYPYPQRRRFFCRHRCGWFGVVVMLAMCPRRRPTPPEMYLYLYEAFIPHFVGHRCQQAPRPVVQAAGNTVSIRIPIFLV